MDILNNDNIKLIPYNTGCEPLPLPEYGRNIQQMVDYCVMLTDRGERTACAYAIIEVMRKLFPFSSNDPSVINKFWDHLNIMARFELDIDFPCEVSGPDDMKRKPEKIPYNTEKIHFRHYGRNIEQLVRIVSSMDDSEEKDELVNLVANSMKKQLMMSNPEGADNGRVLHDLAVLSEGRIVLDPQYYILDNINPNQLGQQGVYPKNKKKKKNGGMYY